jgi:hypothetical protein
MIKHTNTQRSAFVTQHYFSVTVILLALFLFLPAASWSAGGVIDLPRTGQTTCYDTSGTEISCAGTGQDGDIQAGVAWPGPRFVENGDGTVTDKLTGLMWIKDETTTMQWQAALDYVETLGTGGHTDWRLPNIIELRSLVDYARSSPSFPLGNPSPFPNAVPSRYWSSTTLVDDTKAAWYVGFNDGGVGYTNKPDGSCVRPVRTVQFEPVTTTTTTTASPVSTTTTTTTPAGPCPAKTALGGQAPELQLLRLLRDRLMQRSAEGIVYVALYYRNALEISSLLEADPKLKEEARSLIMRLLPMIQKLLAQKAAMIDACNVTQAAALLDNLSALGSPSLKADLLILKTEMQSGRLFKELNISIAGRER